MTVCRSPRLTGYGGRGGPESAGQGVVRRNGFLHHFATVALLSHELR